MCGKFRKFRNETSQVVDRVHILIFIQGLCRGLVELLLVGAVPRGALVVITVPLPGPEVHAEGGDLVRRRLQPPQRPAHLAGLERDPPERHDTFRHEILHCYVISYTFCFLPFPKCCSLR